MKKNFATALALVLVMVLSLTACGGKDDPKPSGGDNSGTTQQSEQPDNTNNTSKPTSTPSETDAPPQDSSKDSEVAAYLKGLGFTVEDVTPQEGFLSFGIRTYTEYDGEVQVNVEEQTAEQQHAFYQRLTAHSRTLSEDGELQGVSSFDMVLEDDTVEDFATGAWTTGWAYIRDGYLFNVTFYYYPAGTSGGYIIGFAATQQ